MSNKYEITVSITPICTSCGGELYIGGIELSGRDESPTRLTHRRVFVGACEKCFIFKGDLEGNHMINKLEQP